MGDVHLGKRLIKGSRLYSRTCNMECYHLIYSCAWLMLILEDLGNIDFCQVVEVTTVLNFQRW